MGNKVSINNTKNEQKEREKEEITNRLIIEKKTKILSQINVDNLLESYNLIIKNNIFEIKLDFPDFEFKFTPIKINLIVEEISNYIVLTYSLKMRINKEEIIESIIPYYISNGKTNMIRSNLLLPFMCFNESLTKNVCPYVTDGLAEGGLIKYNVIKHLNNYIINDQILEKETKKSGDRTDVLSFVSRIENILDFIICLTNNNIINFNNKDIKYYYPQSNDVNDSRELNMNIVSSIYENHNDEFKSELLYKLKNLICVFMDQSFFTFTFTVKDISILKSDVILKEEYNLQMIHICEKNNINSIADNNVNNYIRISNELYINIYNTIKQLQKDEKIKFEEKIYINMFYNLCKHPNMLDSKSLSINISKWKTSCNKEEYKQKYLKYKAKYIKLQTEYLKYKQKYLELNNYKINMKGGVKKDIIIKAANPEVVNIIMKDGLESNGTRYPGTVKN